MTGSNRKLLAHGLLRLHLGREISHWTIPRSALRIGVGSRIMYISHGQKRSGCFEIICSTCNDLNNDLHYDYPIDHSYA